ncbi:MAG: xanthine dehydrogenase family protein subunit M [Desulfurococcales archaeon]|nr:xanthine dehydrogenase family protein subunit M [Desulfurococcales archaeon]
MSSPYTTLPEFTYYKPKTLEEALELLEKYGEEAKVLAGGVGLINFMLEKLMSPKYVVDIKGIEELRGIGYEEGKGLSIGAATRISEITRWLDGNPELKRKYQALYEALSRIADMQIRNRATLAGNVCEALPYMDSYSPLAVYDAEVVIASRSGERRALITEFVQGPGMIDLQPEELVVRIDVPEPPRRSVSGFSKIVPAIEYSIASVSMLAANIEDPATREVRIAVSAATPVPVRVREAEDVFKSQGDIVELLDKALDKLIGEIEYDILEDPYASAEYRKEMIRVQAYQLFLRLLREYRANWG